MSTECILEKQEMQNEVDSKKVRIFTVEINRDLVFREGMSVLFREAILKPAELAVE